MGLGDCEEKIVYHFFTKTENMTDRQVLIDGPDVNHMKNVLRMKPGEKILVSDGKGKNCYCEITELDKMEVRGTVLSDPVEDTELPARVFLFQGLPKSDKMELIIQKAVELGVHEIIPVDTARTVVRLDAKKEDAKIKRWNTISESAAKQSGRLMIPAVQPVMTFKKALDFCGDFELKMIPYEESEFLDCAGGMERTRNLIGSLKPGQRAAVFIGPEGGFDEEEVALARLNGVWPVTLGKRILRTETAGLFVLSAIGYSLER